MNPDPNTAETPEIFNPLDHGIKGFPLMVPAHIFNDWKARAEELEIEKQKYFNAFTSAEADFQRSRSGWASALRRETDQLEKLSASQAEARRLRDVIRAASEPMDSFELMPSGVMLKTLVCFEGETSFCKASEVVKRMKLLREALAPADGKGGQG